MNRLLTCFFLIFFSCSVQGQSLYVNSFGKSSDPAIVFLHGGPGYNAAAFESTTAQTLADRGFFVIVYDRRGEGRSADAAAEFTFDQSFADIDSLYTRFGLTRASLVGHSFGGMLATLYAHRHPSKVKAVVLVGAPVSFQAVLRTIINNSRIIYEERKDSVNLRMINYLAKADTASIDYSSNCFRHAMLNGFYSAKTPTPEAKRILLAFRNDSALFRYAGMMNNAPVRGFWKKEKYTTIDISPQLSMLRATNIRVLGLYGKEDGLFSPQQVRHLQSLIGENQVQYLDNCSHNVFIDRQAEFIKAVSGIAR